MFKFLPLVVIAFTFTARISAGDLVVVEDGRARAEIVVAAERPRMTAHYGDDFVTLWPKRAGTPAGFWEHDLGGSLNGFYALLGGKRDIDHRRGGTPCFTSPGLENNRDHIFGDEPIGDPVIHGTSTSVDRTELVLVANGKSLAPIILPTKPTRFTKIAAADLADYIEKVGGERPKILEGLPNPIPDPAIWVGFQPALKELFPGTDFDFKHPEEILIKCDGKHLAIVGRDVWDPLTNKMKILGGKTEAERKNYLAGFAEANGDVEGFQDEYGTVNAVYTFLQDKLGIRWLWPGADGEVVPKQSQVSLGSFELRYHPKIRMRQT